MRKLTAMALLFCPPMLVAAGVAPQDGNVLFKTASAQTQASDKTSELADELIDCAGMADASARLECYDAVAQPLLGLEQGEGGQGPAALHRFTGKGDWDSEVLEIAGPWRATWQNQGSLLTIELLTPQGEMVSVIGNQIGSGGGRSEVLEPGTYRLAVRGLGGWRVQVVDASQE
jgi:hypothetical protein